MDQIGSALKNYIISRIEWELKEGWLKYVVCSREDVLINHFFMEVRRIARAGGASTKPTRREAKILCRKAIRETPLLVERGRVYTPETTHTMENL